MVSAQCVGKWRFTFVSLCRYIVKHNEHQNIILCILICFQCEGSDLEPYTYKASPLSPTYTLTFLKDFNFLDLFILCIRVFCLYVCALCMSLMSMEIRRRHWRSWNWSQKWLLAATWVLGIESICSAKTNPATKPLIYYLTICPAYKIC